MSIKNKTEETLVRTKNTIEPDQHNAERTSVVSMEFTQREDLVKMRDAGLKI